MKTSSVRFAHLRALLLELQFAESRSGEFWRFEHPATGAVFLYRPYAPNEHVTLQDLVSTRTHLDWRGLLSEKVFDNSFAKAPA